MATPSSGEISISDLQTLYSPVRTAPNNLGDYRAGGSVVAAGEKLSGGTGAAIPSAPSEISLSDFYDLTATVHKATSISASSSTDTFSGIDVNWTADSNGETASSWEIGWKVAPYADPFTFISTDKVGNPITSTSASILIPTSPSTDEHLLCVRGINAFGTGLASDVTAPAYKRARTADFLYDSSASGNVGSVIGFGISSVQIMAAVGGGGGTGGYLYTGASGAGGTASPPSDAGSKWWWSHYAYQKDMAGAGGGGAGSLAYYPATIPVTPDTPISITVGGGTAWSTGGTTTITIDGTTYVQAGGGAIGGVGGIDPSSPVPASDGFTAAANGPSVELSHLQKGYMKQGWVTPVPGVGSSSPDFPVEPDALVASQVAMNSLKFGRAGDGGSGGSVTTGTSANSHNLDGYAGVNVDHNRPIDAWPETFGAMQGAGGKGYTITVPATTTVPGLPGYVDLYGPAFPGSPGPVAVSTGSGGHWLAANFPPSYGKIYSVPGANGPKSFPGHDGFLTTPSSVKTNYAQTALPGFAWLRFNNNPGPVSAPSYAQHSPATWPSQHSANGVSVPSDGAVYFSGWHALYPVATHPVGPGSYGSLSLFTVQCNHSEPNGATGYGGSIGGGNYLSPPTYQTDHTQRITYFPLVSSSPGVILDTGELTSSHTNLNHTNINSPDDTNISYAAGGYGLYDPVAPSDEGQVTDIAKYDWPSGSIASSSIATLSTGRTDHMGFSLGISNQGYVGGGWTGPVTGPTAAVNTMERFAFANDTVAVEPNNIGTARIAGATGASMDYGYMISGKSKIPSLSGNTDYDDITKFTGASGSTSISQTDLAEYPVSGALVGWSEPSYIVTSDPNLRGFSTIVLASENRTAGAGELRDLWYGTLRPGAPSPVLRTTYSGTAVSGMVYGFLLTDANDVERFPFASGYYAADTTTELSTTVSPTAKINYGYGAPAVG